MHTDPPVCVTLASVEAVCAGLPDEPAAWLSETERSRLDAITASRRRRQFLAGRWLARHCLAQWGGGVWHGYVLSASDDGPPLVLTRPAGLADHRTLHLSLSHSADLLACAMATHPIGVDVEDTTRQRDTEALGEMVHGVREKARLMNLEAAERRAQFFAHWTLKEAWIKQAAASPAMSSMEFEPCRAEDAQAVVMRAPTFVLAVAPVRPDELRVHGSALQGVGMAPWRRYADA